MINRLAIFLITIAGSLVILSSAASAATDPFKVVCANGGSASTVCTSDTGTNPLVGPNGLIGKIVKIVAFISGAAAIVIIMISGFTYITSGGEAAKVNSAKNTLLYALIGLAVIVLAQTIIIFVVNRI